MATTTRSPRPRLTLEVLEGRIAPATLQLVGPSFELEATNGLVVDNPPPASGLAFDQSASAEDPQSGIGAHVHHAGTTDGRTFDYSADGSITSTDRLGGWFDFNSVQQQGDLLHILIVPSAGEQAGDPVRVTYALDVEANSLGAGSYTDVTLIASHSAPFHLVVAQGASASGQLNARVGETLLLSLQAMGLLFGLGQTTESFHLLIGLEQAPPPVVPTALRWTASGLEYTYQVTDPVELNTTAALYWSSSNTFADHIGGPIAGTIQPIPAGIGLGSYGPIPVASSLLQNPPPGATHLLVVTDPDNVLGTFSEADVFPLELPDLLIPEDPMSPSGREFRWNVDRNGTIGMGSHRGIDFGYEVGHEDGTGVGLPFATDVEFYWAPTSDFDQSVDVPVVDHSVDPTNPSPASIPLQQSPGVYDYQNDPARWGQPPLINGQRARYLLAVVDPHHGIIESYADTTQAHYRSHDVAALYLHDESEILQDSVQPMYTGDGASIQYTFHPGEGSISVSEAEVALGVDHFNWFQQITALPDNSVSSWQAVTLIDLDYHRQIHVDRVGNVDVIRYNDDNSMVDYYAIDTPFLDPIATTDPDRYTRAIIVTDHGSGREDVMVLYNDPIAPPDPYFSYWNDADGAPGGGPEVALHTYSDRLEFFDRPEFNAAALPAFENGGYVYFRTLLDGVDYDFNVYPTTWLGAGYGTNFLWESNHARDSQGVYTGGVVDEGVYGKASGVDARRPDTGFGGILTARLLEPVAPEDPVHFSQVRATTTTLARVFRISVRGQDPLEGGALRYGLDPSCPAGMRIDPVTGVVTWTPTQAGTFTVTVHATDDRNTSVRGSTSFRMHVVASFDVQTTIALNGATVTATQQSTGPETPVDFALQINTDGTINRQGSHPNSDVQAEIVGTLSPTFDLNNPALTGVLDIIRNASVQQVVIGFLPDVLQDLGLLPSLSLVITAHGSGHLQGGVSIGGERKAPTATVTDFGGDVGLTVDSADLTFTWLGDTYDLFETDATAWSGNGVADHTLARRGALERCGVVPSCFPGWRCHHTDGRGTD